MKSSVPKDSRYLPIVQQKYCCVPASLSVIMYKHDIPLMPQELLGAYLGLTVPKKVKKLFWDVKTGKRPAAGYGTNIQSEKRVNEVCKKLGIPLQMTLRHISKFDKKAFLQYLKGVEETSKDVMVCFDHGVLRGDGNPGGHVCVIDRVNIKEREVRLIDPSPNRPKWRIVKIKKLFQAMQFHGTNKSAGFWEFILV